MLYSRFKMYIKVCMKLNSTDWLVEMNRENFEKNWKSFGTVFKICQKNTCGRAAILKTLQAAIMFERISFILRKLIFQEEFCWHIQMYVFFMWYKRLGAVSGTSSQRVEGNIWKLSWTKFILQLISIVFPNPWTPG